MAKPRAAAPTKKPPIAKAKAKKATAMKKATSAKAKAAPAKKAAPTKKAAPAKKATPAKAKKVTATKKATPVKKATSAKKAAPAKARSAGSKAPSAAFSSIAAQLAANPGIAVARMFGHQGLGLDRRFFAFDHDGELVVRLPPERVRELTAAGVGAPFDPGMGRPSKGWLSVPAGHGDWSRLAEEALTYVATLPPK